MASVNPVPDAHDAFAPAKIAKLVEDAGVRKACLPVPQMGMLAVLAGVYIAFGAMLFTLVMTEPTLGLGLSRWIGGIAFSLGLVLVVIAGAELFTGNNLIVMAWVDGRIGMGAVVRNWVVVYIGNLIGALGAVLLVHLAGTLDIGGGAVGRTAAAIAGAKVEIAFLPALVRGILCNALVCLAVWLCFAARRVSGKILAIVFPISAFVALGFEHSVANMYLIPVGWLAGAPVTVEGMLGNLLPVTIGNIIGGAGGVAGAYWVCYMRKRQA